MKLLLDKQFSSFRWSVEPALDISERVVAGSQGALACLLDLDTLVAAGFAQLQQPLDDPDTGLRAIDRQCCRPPGGFNSDSCGYLFNPVFVRSP